jgi:hypothetical protein
MVVCGGQASGRLLHFRAVPAGRHDCWPLWPSTRRGTAGAHDGDVSSDGSAHPGPLPAAFLAGPSGLGVECLALAGEPGA